MGGPRFFSSCGCNATTVCSGHSSSGYSQSRLRPPWPFRRKPPEPKPPPQSSPDPTDYEVLESWTEGRYTVLEVRYPSCTNYEGRKILVLDQPFMGGRLDPHFCDGVHVSPIARFVPTEQGWQMALLLVETLAGALDEEK